ncbi:unnamed protein product [Caenorhabditis angaria]|uniref:Uncharacterized protein n=1 Tax=Caenorhabditis angaria TaxID=860376 RepID=A0A9P1I800_9PELO|nr:unnamed protein product [Caenorhabditis angaria]
METLDIDSDYGVHKDQLRRSINATEKAIDVIRDGDLARRQVSLELRDLQLTMHEDLERIRGEMSEFDNKLNSERIESAKWMDKKVKEAKKTADEALRSSTLLKDVQLLEKKVDILKESVINVNRAYFKYQKNVDMKDLKNQITEMVYRTEKKERDLLNQFDGTNLEEKSEVILRGAIEGLLGLQATNPQFLKEARSLAAELRVYRDAAANNNLFNLISKEDNESVQSESTSESASSVPFSNSTSFKSSEDKSETTSSAASSASTSSYTTASASTSKSSKASKKKSSKKSTSSNVTI